MGAPEQRTGYRDAALSVGVEQRIANARSAARQRVISHAGGDGVLFWPGRTSARGEHQNGREPCCGCGAVVGWRGSASCGSRTGVVSNSATTGP
jgi:hypothetical protein